MCEIYDQLRACGFSNATSCPYESGCLFSKVTFADPEDIDVASNCQAAKDEIASRDKILNTEDIEIENEIKTLVSIRRLN